MSKTVSAVSAFNGDIVKNGKSSFGDKSQINSNDSGLDNLPSRSLPALYKTRT